MSWAPRDRVTGEITRNPARSDRAIAEAAGCDCGRVARARRVLERDGQIPHIEPADRVERPRPRQPRRNRDRAIRVLAANPWRSDGLLARQARIGVTTVCEARHQLEHTGQIPVVDPDRREHRTPSPRTGRGRTAIQRGARTPRQVADAAGISYGAAWKALAIERNRPKMPRPPPPPQQCEQCGNMFDPPNPPRGNPPRYCSKGCGHAAQTARRRANRPPPEPRPPKVPELPNPPSWEKGLCTHTPKSQRSWWTSDNPVLREGAANICGVCPVAEPCLEWSLALPPDDNVSTRAWAAGNGRRSGACSDAGETGVAGHSGGRLAAC